MEYSLPHSLPLVLQELLRIPERVSLEGDALVWDWGTAQLVPCDDVLGAFTMLAGGKLGRPSRGAVLKFAELYGPLYARMEPVEGRDAEVWREPLEDWRTWAESVQAAAKLARKLGEGGEVSRADLDVIPEAPEPRTGSYGLWLYQVMTRADPKDVPGLIEGGTRWTDFEVWLRRQVIWFGDDKPGSALQSSEERARVYVQGWVDGLLDLANAQLQLGWHQGEGLRIILYGRSFPAVVAGQLICAAHGGKIAVCHSCGCVITSGRKRPIGQRAFCDRTCRDAFNKQHKREERARRSAEDASP